MDKASSIMSKSRKSRRRFISGKASNLNSSIRGSVRSSSKGSMKSISERDDQRGKGRTQIISDFDSEDSDSMSIT